MRGRKRTVERRKSKRYKAVEGAYAAISPKSRKLGQIINLSIGGVCFKYIDNNNDDQDAGTQREVSIFLSSLRYYVGNLFFKTVCDCEVTDTPSSNSMKIRKRRVQFTDLNFKQLFDLDNYLKNNTSELLE